MASLMERVQARQRVRGPSCSVGQLLDSADKDLRAELDEVLASDLASTLIVEELKDMGYQISRDAMQRHRRRACACP